MNLTTNFQHFKEGFNFVYDNRVNHTFSIEHLKVTRELAKSELSGMLNGDLSQEQVLMRLGEISAFDALITIKMVTGEEHGLFS